MPQFPRVGLRPQVAAVAVVARHISFGKVVVPQAGVGRPSGCRCGAAVGAIRAERAVGAASVLRAGAAIVAVAV